MHRVRRVHRLENEAQAKAYLHPVRVRILGFVGPRSMTISQVAVRLGVHPANLTHHFKKLVSARLIRLVEERDTGRVVEKYYRAVALRFELRDDGRVGHGVRQRALRVLLRDLRDAARGLPPDARDVVCLLARARISLRTFERFSGRLEDLVADFRASATRDRKRGRACQAFTLNLSFYPRPGGRPSPWH